MPHLKKYEKVEKKAKEICPQLMSLIVLSHKSKVK